MEKLNFVNSSSIIFAENSINQNVKNHFEDSVPSISMVKKCNNEFRCGSTSISYAEHFGRPIEDAALKQLEQINSLVLTYWSLEWGEVVEALGIPNDSVVSILNGKAICKMGATFPHNYL